MEFEEDPFPNYFYNLCDYSSVSGIRFIGNYFITQINEKCQTTTATSQLHLFFKCLRNLCKGCDIKYCLENYICVNKISWCID